MGSAPEKAKLDDRAKASGPSHDQALKRPRDEIADHDDRLGALAKISEADARNAALAKFPGATIQKASLEDENGSVVWAVELTDANNAAQEVKVDAGNAAILAVESGGEDNETFLASNA